MSDVPARDSDLDDLEGASLESKYVIFRRADFFDWLNTYVFMGQVGLVPEELDPDTYFVIKEKDVFGPAALHGYAHTVQSALELDSLPGRPRTFTPSEAERLGTVVEAVVTRALRWQRSPKKVPD